MRIEPEPREVRRLVVWTFRELGTPSYALFDLEEEIVMRQGRCVARTYRADEFLAKWLIDIGLLQFFDADGEMLRTINLFERVKPLAVAA